MPVSQSKIDVRRVAQFADHAVREDQEYTQEEVAEALGMSLQQAQRAVHQLLEREPWRCAAQIDIEMGSDWFAIG